MTILYEEDWGRYPSAIVHYETRNRSWVELAKKLELSGVRNNKFFLALINPELRYIDPWDENHPEKVKLAIATEISINPWYFFREIARFDKKEFGGKRYYINANRGNIAAWWCYFNRQDYNLTQPRQSGKSTSSNWLVVWLMFFRYRDSDIFLLTKDNTLRQNNVRSIKTYRDLLPDYLNPTTKKDVNNLIGITCTALGNRLYTAVSQNSKADADKVGRGFSCKTYIIDEGPYVDYLETSLNAMLPGGDAKQAEAEEKGEPYCNVYTTTCGSKADVSGRYYYDMVTNCLQWKDSLYDCKDEPMLKQLVDKNSTVKRLVNLVFNHRQLGYSDEWLINILKKNGSVGAKANKDYFNIWDDGSAESPLDKDLAKVIRDSSRDPKYSEYTKEGYVINWYIEKNSIANRMATQKFVMGLDTSDAVGRDAIAVTIVDVHSLEIVGSMLIKETNLMVFGYWLVDFMVKYENIVLIPERKNQAASLIDLLLIRLPINQQDPLKRIFNRLVHEGRIDDPKYKQYTRYLPTGVEAYKEIKDQFGYATSGSGEYSRNALYRDTLILACEYGGSVMNDEGTIKEILALERKNGRIDHGSDGNDDRVVSWLLTAWLLISGRGLNHYGINNPLSKAMDYRDRAKLDRGDKTLSKRLEDNERQLELKDEIDGYLSLLKNVKEEFLSSRYEAKLRMLEKEYTGTEFGALTVSDLIRQAKADKGKNRMNRRNKARDWG